MSNTKSVLKLLLKIAGHTSVFIAGVITGLITSSGAAVWPFFLGLIFMVLFFPLGLFLLAIAAIILLVGGVVGGLTFYTKFLTDTTTRPNGQTENQTA